jgi:hypothetical protein
VKRNLQSFHIFPDNSLRRQKKECTGKLVLKEGMRIVRILSSSLEVEESSPEHFFFQTFFLLLFNSFFLLLFQFILSSSFSIQLLKISTK